MSGKYDSKMQEDEEEDNNMYSQNTPEAWTESQPDNDVEFQAAAATSQSALQFAAISENEKSSLRAELQGYLTDLKQRTGSDGELLVHMPTNFDEVADSMDRDDLESREEVPWSKYLLSRDVTYDASLEKGNGDDPASARYKDMDANEDAAAVRLEEAMARVKLLDSKLKAVGRRDLQIRHDLNSRSIRDVNDADSEAPTSGRQSARSIASSRMNDHTFLTRARSEKGQSSAGSVGGSSAMSSPQMSARSEASHADSPPSAHLAPEEHKASSPAQESRPPRVDAVERNIQSLQGKPKALSDEEELRLRCLLDCPEGSAEWIELSRFGVSREQEEQIRELDARLEDEYGRTHRYATPGAVEVAPAAETDGRPDYLTVLRAEREQGQAAKYIDGLLKQTRRVADLSGLADPVVLPADPAEGGGGEPDMGLLLDVPCFAEVPGGRKVTSQDVAVLLGSVRQMLVPAAQTRGALQQQDDAQPNDDEGQEQGQDAGPGSTALEETGPAAQMQPATLAKRRDIDRLLAGLQTDVRRLSDLRSQLGGLMATASSLRSLVDGVEEEAGAAGKENGHRDNFAESERAKEKMKDVDAEVEDLYLRYGKPAQAPEALEGGRANPNVPVLEPLVNIAEFRGKLESLKEKGRSKRSVNALGAPQSAAQASIGAGLRLRMLRNNLGADPHTEEQEQPQKKQQEREEQEMKEEGLPPPPRPRQEGSMPQKLVI